MAAYKAMPTYRVKIMLFLLMYFIVSALAGEISDSRKCADKACQVTISRGQALARHSASSPLYLSFSRGDIIEIKSKSAGSRPDLWGGEVNGRRGYFPKSYVREFGAVQAEPVYEVPTEESEWAKKTQSQQPPPGQGSPQPPQVQDTQVEKDETEVDETDLTGSEDVGGEPAPQSEDQKQDSSASKLDAGHTEETVEDETEIEDGDPVAAKKDSLLKEIEALQQSFHKMKEIQQDATELNKILASKFAAESSQFATASEKETAEPTETEQSQTPDSSDPRGGLQVDDETDLDSEEGDYLFPNKEQGIGDMGSENDVQQVQEEQKEKEGDEKQAPDEKKPSEEESDKKQPAEEKNDVKQTEEEKKEEDSPYISGVRVLDDDDDEEEEEEEVEKKETEESHGQDEKPESSDKSDTDADIAVEEQKDDDETGADETELPDSPLDSPPDGSLDVSPDGLLDGSPDGLPDDSPDGSPDSREHEYKEKLPDEPSGVKFSSELGGEAGVDAGDRYMTGVGEDIDQMAKELTDKAAEEEESLKDVKMMTTNIPDIGASKPSSVDELEDMPGIEKVEPAVSEGLGAAKTKEEAGDEEVNRELHFRSEMAGKDQEVAQEQVEKTDDETSELERHDEEKADADELSVEADEKTRVVTETEDKDVGTDEDTDTLTKLSEEDEHETPQPQKSIPPSPVQTDKASFQPEDIDFIHPSGTKDKDNGVTLESSQTEPEPHQQAQTPVLQGTPSLEQTGQQSEVSEDGGQQKPEAAQTEAPVDEGETPTSVIDGTTFYVIDGEIADIVPESVSHRKESVAVHREPVMSPPLVQSTPAEDVQPTAVPLMPEMAAKQQEDEAPTQPPGTFTDAGNQETVNASHEVPGDETAGLPKPEDIVKQDLHSGHYQTNADFVSRKMLSVNQPHSQIPTPPSPASEPAVPAEQDTQKAPESVDTMNTKQPDFQESSIATETVINSATTASDIQPSDIHPSGTAESSTASVTIEGEEEQDSSQSQGGQGSQTAGDGRGTVAPPLAFDVPPAEKMVGNGHTEHEKPAEQMEESASQAPDAQAWDGIPPPPTSDDTTPPSDEWAPDQDSQNDEPTLESDPYQMDDYYSRKITDEEVTKAEEEAAAFQSRSGTVMGSLEAQTKIFIDKLPPSLQSLLEQEPLGLSPAMTVLVTMTTLVMFLTITCFSCLCTGGKKSGKKDPLIVVRELEERLLMAVKEKENLEDLLQERQSEGNRLKEELAGLRNSSGSVQTDLQNVTLHNEALKAQVESLQTEIVELQDQLSRKSDDVKVKDKKTKDIEKETKKLNEAKAKVEKELQKKENERQLLQDENENLKSTVQSLTDQVQLLDTSKQQLLAEAEDWKEKVDELKERLDQVEQECKQAQETISFKDNELEVMKDCYLQLKAFEKEGGQGDEEEEYDTGGDSKDVQEKIQAMMDVSKVNATLRAVQEEKDILENKLKIENDARRELEEQLECVRRETESSMADKMKAERQCQEAQTKLQVLSSYFKEKELQLQRELGEQEALKKQNLSRLDSADETTRSMSKELEMSKQQVESLKRELAASERDFRSQIAANEKKAHENWLNARAAERELKEARHEAAVLRQKLTDVERRHMGPGGLIRPLPTRGMPPPGMLNGPPPPPPPGMERSPSRGSLPPGAIPPGPHPPPFRDDDFPISPRERQRLPPSHPALHMPPMEARSPPPRLPPPDVRGSPPQLPPPDARSPPPRMPPPYDRRGPPHPMDSRSPPMRGPPPDMVPPLRGPLPPHMAPPPMGSPVPRDSPREGYSPRESRPGQSPRDQYGRPPPPGGEGRRHQSQV